MRYGFYTHINKLIRKNNLSISRLSRAINVSRPHLSGVINGTYVLTYEVATKLAEFLFVPTLDLLVRYGETYSANKKGYENSGYFLAKIFCLHYEYDFILTKNNKEYKVSGFRFNKNKLYFQIFANDSLRFISVDRFDDLIIREERQDENTGDDS